MSHNTALQYLNCYSNSLSGLDVSHNTALIELVCYGNLFSTDVVDELFCSLPDRAEDDNAKVYILNNTAEVNYDNVIASNKQNALDKNWAVWYYDNYIGSLHNTEPATTGNYECGSGNASVTGVSVTPATITLGISATQQLTATVAPTEAANQNVTWSSSNNGVATVDESGLVTAVAPGNAIITVTTDDGGFTATCSVTVESNTVSVTNISVSPTSIALDINTIGQLIATITPSNASNQNVTWGSSNNGVATVDENGLVTAVAQGNAVIIVITADGGFTATCNVTVNNANAIDIPVNRDNLTLYPNPVGSLLNIESSTTIHKIEVCNFLGQIVDVVNTNNHSYQYHTEKLNAGYYMFKIHTDNGVVVKKVMKR